MWKFKYYERELIINNQSKKGIAIITGWTKKDLIYNALSEESKNNVAVIGQLYSKDGINYIIRNVFLNPHINFIIITGLDLSGSIQGLRDFFDNGKFEFLQTDIPKQYVLEFQEYFSKNHLFVEKDNINKVISEVSKKIDNSRSISKTIDFPNANKKEIQTYPSEETVFRLEGTKIHNLWLKCLDRILKFGRIKKSQYGELQRELVNVITVINNEDIDDVEIPNFIPFKKENILQYYPQMLTGFIPDGIEYTYGSRLRNHNGINQIQSMIDQLKEENYTRRAVAITWNVEKDDNNTHSPCLDLIQGLVQENILYITAYFRSNDMYEAWFENVCGLRKIQKEIADAVEAKVGKLTIVSSSAHIYERDFAKAIEIVNKYKPKYEFILDPRGSFEIKVEQENIVVNHYSTDGIFIQNFTGKSAANLRQQVYPFISDIGHGMFIGEELMKAEYDLKSRK